MSTNQFSKVDMVPMLEIDYSEDESESTTYGMWLAKLPYNPIFAVGERVNIIILFELK